MFSTVLGKLRNSIPETRHKWYIRIFYESNIPKLCKYSKFPQVCSRWRCHQRWQGGCCHMGLLSWILSSKCVSFMISAIPIRYGCVKQWLVSTPVNDDKHPGHTKWPKPTTPPLGNGSALFSRLVPVVWGDDIFREPWENSSNGQVLIEITVSFVVQFLCVWKVQGFFDVLAKVV